MTFYDVIVVGAGMGGSSVAGELSKLNKNISVALISAGPRLSEKPKEILFEMQNSGQTMVSKVFLGRGGNTRIYGAQLERMNERVFLEDKNYKPNINFPFTYEEIRPYYKSAEYLLHAKLLRLNKGDYAIKKAVQASGFFLKKLLVGIKDIKDCDGCGGKICKKNCKIDSFSAFVTDDTIVYDNFEIQEIKKKGDVYLINENSGKRRLTCAKVILSTGVVSSTTILKKFLNGFKAKYKNQSYSLPIGEGITFHISDFFLLIPKFFVIPSGKKIINTSEFKFRDLSVSLQSIGAPLKKEYIVSYLIKKYTIQSKVITFLINIIAFIAERILRTSHIVATIVEDPVEKNNSIDKDSTSHKTKVKLNYKLDTKLHENIIHLNKDIKDKLSKKFFVLPFGGNANLNLGHIMGGCRCGESPLNSVVDKSLKVWGVKGLYVCDTSVIPSSGTANPSLTVAALGLRLAKKLAKK